MQAELAEWYYSGKDLKQDYKKSLKWFEAAGASGHVFALYNAGVQYENGEGIPADKNKAIEYYRKAAAGGLKAAEDAIKRLVPEK